MGYYYRIKCRIKEEGIACTIKYIFLVSFHCLIGFMRDNIMDLKYSRRLLHGNQKSPYKHMGANDTYHTDYSVMPLIFRQLTIKASDVLVDVGCGKGRVINFWLGKKLHNKIYGLEIDPVIARNVASQYTDRKNVTIISGDAIQNLPQEGTIFYFYNPFSELKVREFEEKLRSFPTSNIKIIYYNPKSIQVFDNDCWHIHHINFERDLGVKRWGRLNKYHDLCIIRKK